MSPGAGGLAQTAPAVTSTIAVSRMSMTRQPHRADRAGRLHGGRVHAPPRRAPRRPPRGPPVVAAGEGITVLPRLAVADLADGLIARPLIHPVVERRIVVHARRDRRRHVLIDTAVAQLQDSAARPPPEGPAAVRTPDPRAPDPRRMVAAVQVDRGR